MIDEVEETLVGPVQVLEDKHERTLFRQPFEEAPPCCERLHTLLGHLQVPTEPNQGPEM